MIFLRVLPKIFLWPHYSGAPGARGPPVHWTAWTPGSYATECGVPCWYQLVGGLSLSGACRDRLAANGLDRPRRVRRSANITWMNILSVNITSRNSDLKMSTKIVGMLPRRENPSKPADYDKWNYTPCMLQKTTPSDARLVPTITWSNMSDFNKFGRFISEGCWLKWHIQFPHHLTFVSTLPGEIKMVNLTHSRVIQQLILSTTHQ